MKKLVQRHFVDRWGREGTLFFAPGRVNLLGEHVDYNGGTVLPMALQKGTYVCAAKRDDGRFFASSENFDQTYELTVGSAMPQGWGRYLWAVLAACSEQGLPLSGAELHFGGDLPEGAGLSSSASLEVATVMTLKGLFGWDLTDQQVALLAHRAENGFVGVACGIMDQFASALCHEGCALHLDCSSQNYEHWPLPQGFVVAVTDSGVRRELSESRYNERRSQCESALRTLGAHKPLKDLCSASLEDLALLQGDELKRARHCVTEARRLEAAKKALARGDGEAFGALMTECHASLRDDFEVSHPALDCLVEASLKVEGCYGARLTGAGFGGCTVALLAPGAFEAYERALCQAAQEQGFPKPKSFLTGPCAGACSWRNDG